MYIYIHTSHMARCVSQTRRRIISTLVSSNRNMSVAFDESPCLHEHNHYNMTKNVKDWYCKNANQIQ